MSSFYRDIKMTIDLHEHRLYISDILEIDITHLETYILMHTTIKLRLCLIEFWLSEEYVLLK